MKNIFSQLKKNLLDPGFLLSVAFAVIIVAVVNSYARKISFVATAEDSIMGAISPK